MFNKDILRDKGNVSLLLEDIDLIESEISEKAKIEIYNHKDLGKVLTINDEIQHVESWASLYHESVVHLPCCFAKTISNVLILGGGDLFAAYEVLKYHSVESVLLVDHDKTVIDLINRNYSHSSKVLSDNRLSIKYMDAIEFLRNTDLSFDLIINDAIDLLASNQSSRIFSLLNNRLTNNGICSDLIYRHIYDLGHLHKTISILEETKNKAFSLTVVPEYPGVLHLLTMFGNTNNIDQNLKTSINEEHKSLDFVSNKLDFFNPQFLSFYLYIPPYLKRIMYTK